jgi:hypothetical protein
VIVERTHSLISASESPEALYCPGARNAFGHDENPNPL